jgi:hypothetical protein
MRASTPVARIASKRMRVAAAPVITWRFVRERLGAR